MAALVFGLAALESARVFEWTLALWFILLAALVDGVDGIVARRLGASSATGEQLDSLADIVAFGVAPAFLFWTFYDGSPAALRYGVGFSFVLAGAYRLARFHAVPCTSGFRGLPTTVAGPLFALAVAGPFDLGALGAGGIGVVLAVLMLRDHPFPSLSLSRRWLIPAVAGSLVPVIIWPLAETIALMGLVLLGVYVLLGLGSAMRKVPR